MSDSYRTRGGDEEEDELQMVCRRFVEEWEAGRRPTLQGYVERYPRHSLALTDFVLVYLGIESAASRYPEPKEPSPLTYRAISHARRTLGLSENMPSATLAAARQAKGWTPADLAKRLRLPAPVIIWLERGEITDWPRRLEQRLADLFSMRIEQAAALLIVPEREGMAVFNPSLVRETPTRTFAEALAESGADAETLAEWL